MPDPHPNPTVAIQREERNIDIEYRLVDGGNDAPLMVFLHEGLGSVSMWRDWPDQACAALRCRGLVFSRYGYGQSTPRLSEDIRQVSYLHHEAACDLPAVLDALGMAAERPVLFGHSDGGSIALLYAAMHSDRVRGIIVAAPHIFVEDITVEGIRAARTLYETTDFPKRLARHHRDADSVFYSWNDTWLAPEFRQWNIETEVGAIRCPILAMQGEDDEYGTLEQIYGIERLAPQTIPYAIPACGHSPHRDQPQAVLDALRDFVSQVA